MDLSVHIRIRFHHYQHFIFFLTFNIRQFEAKPKLGGDRFASAFRQKIENQIQEKFQFFNETNEMKYKNFVVSQVTNYIFIQRVYRN